MQTRISGAHEALKAGKVLTLATWILDEGVEAHRAPMDFYVSLALGMPEACFSLNFGISPDFQGKFRTKRNRLSDILTSTHDTLSAGMQARRLPRSPTKEWFA